MKLWQRGGGGGNGAALLCWIWCLGREKEGDLAIATHGRRRRQHAASHRCTDLLSLATKAGGGGTTIREKNIKNQKSKRDSRFAFWTSLYFSGSF